MSLKNNLYSACLNLLEKRILTHEAALNDLTKDAGNDSKSSAGDKHETARAMMQIEHEKISRQLQEVLAQREILVRIDSAIKSDHVTLGSLVKTDKGYLYLSIPIGRINVNEIPVIVLSPQSPLGKQLMGLKTNDTAIINNVRYMIEEIS